MKSQTYYFVMAISAALGTAALLSTPATLGYFFAQTVLAVLCVVVMILATMSWSRMYADILGDPSTLRNPVDHC